MALGTLDIVTDTTVKQFLEKMDLQNAILAAIANREGGSDVPTIEINNMLMVQQLVRMGVASKIFTVGGQILCNHEQFGTLAWDIIGIDVDKPTDPQYKYSMTLQLHDCIKAATYQFDAPEPTNPDSNRKSYGSNNWSQSAIRQWLNSDGEAGKWWMAQTEYDVAPAFASSQAGFLKGLDKEFLGVIGNVDKITAKPNIDGGGSETLSEKFFLPSMTEVYGGENNGIAEGIVYPYYANGSTLEAPGTGADTNRIKNKGDAATTWWLRSCNPTDSYYERIVVTSGTVVNSNANNSYGVAPACCII